MARILIVDDAIFMRKLLVDIFVAEGHEIVGEGTSAKDAVEMFSALNPGLMTTLDVNMPQESGIDTPLKYLSISEPDIRRLINV